MQIFLQPLWGYQLSYPDDWQHRTLGDMEGFAARAEDLQEGPSFAESSHLLVRAEWNGLRRPVDTLWAQHLAQTAGFLGAKNVRPAVWRMAGAAGYEAEIVMSKRENRRVWAGILSYQFMILQAVLEHAREERSRYEPAATEILKSLRFLRQVAGIAEDARGLPIPPGYRPVSPRSILPDVTQEHLWEAYSGAGSAGALQAFCLREATARDWKLQEMAPYPGPYGLGFARLRFSRAGATATLGVMPYGDAPGSNSPANLVIRYEET